MMKIPLYYKIYKDLQYKICSNAYQPGSLLPTEAELEKIYGTSRAPVRQALSALENEGLVLRQQGKGTFVSSQERSSPWLIATGFLKDYKRFWNDLTAKTLETELRIAPDEEISNFLRVSTETKTTYIVRLQYLKNSPAIILENYFSPQYDLSVFQAAGNFMSLKELLLSKFDTSIRKIHEKIAVRVPPPRFAKYLQIPVNTPILRVRRFMSDDLEKPVLVSNQYVFTDKWEYETDFTL